MVRLTSTTDQARRICSFVASSQIANMLCLAAAVILFGVVPLAAGAESVDELLQSGKLAEARSNLEKQVQASPQDALATTQLGVVQFLQAIEQLAQTNYRQGIGNQRALMFGFRMPVPPIENPQEVTYDDLRETFERLIVGLSTAEATLARVGNAEVKWKVDIAALRLDLNGDGHMGAKESLGEVYWSLIDPNGFRRRLAREPQRNADLQFIVGIDTADVYWLRGYCHMISALAEAILAYDQQRMFDHTGHLIFPRAKVSHEFLKPISGENRNGFDLERIFDAVAAVHLIDWQLKEPKRLQSAHNHLLAMITTSRASWAAIARETDNDHEWIPGPNQQTVMPNGAINQQQIDTWLAFLEEAEALLTGEKLAPFWRGDSQRGVNLHRVFYEPRRFDLVLWIHGSSAAPYLDEGEVTKQQTWATFQRVFRGDFIGFAFWIN